MATQNINQFVFQKIYLFPANQNMDLSLASDERDYDDEVVFSEQLIAYFDGNRLPFQFDINDLDSSPEYNLTYKNYNPNNILLSTNYWNPNNVDLSCYTAATLCDIGLTGTDNGLVEQMSGESITYTNGLIPDIDKFNRTMFDRRMKLFQVTGYTSSPNLRFSGYSATTLYEIVSKTGTTEGVYHELYGGFYQGFYKLFGYDYDIFPSRVSKGWTVELLLKPRLYPEYFPSSGETTLNGYYPGNKNMFFYMGARGENKYYHYADGFPASDSGYTRVTSGLTCLETCACSNTAVTNSDCISVYPPSAVTVDHAYGPCGYYNETMLFPELDPAWDSISNAISLRFCGDLTNPRLGVKVLRFIGDCVTTGSCETTGITYETGYTITEYCSPNGIYDICFSGDSENSFIYDEHWVQVDVVFERYSFFDECDLNYKGGLGLITKNEYLDSIYDNSVALIQPPNTHDGTAPETIEVIQLNEEWLLERQYRLGTLKFYVNGMLFYTIEDFEEIIPRGMNTRKERQIGVPFNISVGGGTQGLHESLVFSGCPTGNTNTYIQDPELVPNVILTGTTLSGLSTNILIEQNFASNFDGAISQFRMYIEPLSSAQIQHNFRLLKDKFNLFDYFCDRSCQNSDFTCGTLSAITETQSLCDTDNFTVSVNIIDILNYPVDNIVVLTGGTIVEQIPIIYTGTTIVGPYSSVEEIEIKISNAVNQVCDLNLGTFTDPKYPVVDYIVYSAVDVAFELSANTGNTYYIVTNISGVTNNWSSHVGEILSGGTWIVPNNGDIIRESSITGPESYWESIGGVPVQVFAPILFNYFEITNNFGFNISNISSFSSGSTATIYYLCDGGIPQLFYSGSTSALTTTQSFGPTCSVSALTGNIIYNINGCDYNIRAIVSSVLNVGAIDTDFSNGGLNEYIVVARIQTDNKIIVGGGFTYYGTTPANYLTRLNSDGTLDTTYNNTLGFGLNGPVLGIEYDISGRTLVCGFFTTLNGISSNRIVRLLDDGTIDPSFNIGSGFVGSYVQDMCILPDGSIACVGLFSSYNGTTANNIIVLNEDGSINTSWNFGVGLSSFGQEIEVDNYGRLILVSFLPFYNGAPAPNPVRILPGGSIDPTFNIGTGILGGANDIRILADDRLVFVGGMTGYNSLPVNGILCINDDGTYDNSFMSNVVSGFGQTFQDVIQLPNGNIMISGPLAPDGALGSAANRIIRLFEDGTRDTSFNIGTGPNFRVWDLQYSLVDGSIVAFGQFTTYQGAQRLRVVKII